MHDAAPMEQQVTRVMQTGLNKRMEVHSGLLLWTHFTLPQRQGTSRLCSCCRSARSTSDVDAKDDNENTALSWAAEEGHEVVVQLLLEHKFQTTLRRIAKRSDGEDVRGKGR
jgi:hypothetical protein